VFRRLLRPGMGAVDLGVNIGLLTMPFVSMVGMAGWALAMEPNPANVKLLEASRRANGLGQAARHAIVRTGLSANLWGWRVLAWGAWHDRRRLARVPGGSGRSSRPWCSAAGCWATKVSAFPVPPWTVWLASPEKGSASGCASRRGAEMQRPLSRGAAGQGVAVRDIVVREVSGPAGSLRDGTAPPHGGGTRRTLGSSGRPPGR